MVALLQIVPPDAIATLTVAFLGLGIQALGVYGTYKYFTGKTETRIAALERSDQQQWPKINRAAEDLRYLQGRMEGQAEERTRGAAAGTD